MNFTHIEETTVFYGLPVKTISQIINYLT